MGGGQGFGGSVGKPGSGDYGVPLHGPNCRCQKCQEQHRETSYDGEYETPFSRVQSE